MLVLKVKEGPDTGSEFSYRNEPRIIIGRGSRQLKLTDRMISHAHARIKESNGGWFIRDVKSRNGTFVNGHRVLGDTRLNVGDEIKVGLTVLQFQLKSDPKNQSDPLDETIDSIEAFLSIPDDGKPVNSGMLEVEKALASEPEIDLSDDDSDSTAKEKRDSNAKKSTPSRIEPDVEDAIKQPVVTDSDYEAASSESRVDFIDDTDAEVNAADDDVDTRAPDNPVTVRSARDHDKALSGDDYLMGALAFDQAAAMVDQNDNDDDAPIEQLNPAEIRSQSDAVAPADSESAANDWQSLVNDTLSKGDERAWGDQDSDELKDANSGDAAAAAALLEELSREEGSKGDAKDDLPDDDGSDFEQYLKQQQSGINSDVSENTKAKMP